MIVINSFLLVEHDIFQIPIFDSCVESSEQRRGPQIQVSGHEGGQFPPTVSRINSLKELSRTSGRPTTQEYEKNWHLTLSSIIKGER